MKWFKRQTHGAVQFAQFGFIGILNALVDIGSLNLLLWLFPTDERALLVTYNTISYTLAILNSYFWNSKLTFKHHAAYTKREKVAFVIQALVALLISNIVFISVVQLLELTSLRPFVARNISKGLAMFLSSTASFFFMKFFVFKKKGVS
ncbi:GtrA family protein [Bacillus tianshenii]|nr:GtrA family protein [Bacillus tianshenii]